MKLMYELAIKLIDIYILISSLFNKKLKRIYEGRKDTFKYIDENIDIQKNILIHVSSVGEFEQAKPIIDGLRSLNKFEIIVSFFLHQLKIKSRKINLFIIVFTFHPIQKKIWNSY